MVYDSEFPPYPPTKYVTGAIDSSSFNKEVERPDASPPIDEIETAAMKSFDESTARTPEVEPVAWLAEDNRLTPQGRSLHFEKSTAKAHSTGEPVPLYASPPEERTPAEG